jgi:hypothetical protein
MACAEIETQRFATRLAALDPLAWFNQGDRSAPGAGAVYVFH